jgi:Tfp pilus assembly protein PilV
MKQRDGFTLISVIVAITLLSVGVMAMANSMFYITKVTRLENQRTQALQLASLHMEDLRARNPWTLASETSTVVDSTGAANANGQFTRSVAVTITPRNSDRPIRLTTLIFKVLT